MHKQIHICNGFSQKNESYECDDQSRLVIIHGMDSEDENQRKESLAGMQNEPEEHHQANDLNTEGGHHAFVPHIMLTSGGKWSTITIH